MDKSVYSVGQVNRYLKGLFAQDLLLSRISVRGEVTNCNYNSAGHVFFSLKDASGTLPCILFAGNRAGLTFPMKDGDQVVVHGNIDIYEAQGRYQLYAKSIESEGAGELYERFLALKAELEERGMFAQEYKKELPPYPRTIGVVTSPTGAAIRDIENIAARRNPYVQLILRPALVQGEGAARSVAQGIRALDAYGVDLIIVGRGGGSLEDLWAFNEEEVATAIFESATPIVSAVGHETDTTIADFVADLRAPTPSAAAELTVFPAEAFAATLQSYATELYRSLEGKAKRKRQAWALSAARLRSMRPDHQIQNRRHRILELTGRLQEAVREQFSEARASREAYAARIPDALFWKMRNRRQRYEVLLARMEGKNPLSRLSKGYAYVTNAKNKPVRKVKDVRRGDLLSLYVTDGVIETEVTEVKGHE